MSDRDSNRAIAEYAARFHAALGPVHGAASPLGAWILLTLAAQATDGPARAELERVLGVPAPEALDFVRGLFDNPHPAVAAAIALWNDPSIYNEAFGRWHEALPETVARGPVPSREVADAWVRHATRGAIAKMPVWDDFSVLVLASALAVDGAWYDEFICMPSAELGDSPWARDVEQVLRTHDAGHSIRWTPSAGEVAVHVRPTRSDFIVTSVIAAPDVPLERVIAAAHEVASGSDRVERRSLFSLPLGDGHSWTITEEEVEADHADSRTQSGRIVLPAWKAETPPIDLLKHEGFGFRPAVRALESLLPFSPDGYATRAIQVTNAAYDRYGFRASSVTMSTTFDTMAMSWDRERHVGLHRHVEVRFGRPYAVVAYADGPGERPHPWRGVPLFSAWVTQPMEPEPMKREEMSEFEIIEETSLEP